MLMRLALFIILAFFIGRALWRLLDGIVEGATGSRTGGGHVPQRGVQMIRDPVCGTFVVRDRALTLTDGRTELFFCSDTCRDAYRKRPSAGSGRSERAEGRSA
jgi:YHS domain-containing protein